MAKPILELISEEIVSRLGNISVANGYEFTIVSAELVNRKTNTWQPEPLKIKVDYGDVSENEELSYPGNPPRKAFDAVFEISGYASDIDRDVDEVGMVNPSVTDTQMMSAMAKAITNNSAVDWHWFGTNVDGDPYAINAKISSMETFDAPGLDGARIMLEVTYRTSEINQYSL